MSLMASTHLRFLTLSTPTLSFSRQKITTINTISTHCSPNPDIQSNNDNNDENMTAASSTSFDIERRRPSVITRYPEKGTTIQRPEPPNFEIGWKRTKEINNEKPKGWMVADFLEKLESLMGRGRYGSTELLAKAGAIVAERAKEEAELLVAGGDVEERVATELYRVLRLIEMDMEMVKAAVKQETLAQRLEQARARCRQAILVALSF